MYASDYKAQGIVSQILYLGHHRYLSPLHAVFMPCLVLTHAENVHLQKLCVTIWNHYVQKKIGSTSEKIKIKKREKNT